MALLTVYLPDGTEAIVESVDAREYVEYCGYSYTKPSNAKPSNAKQAAAEQAAAEQAAAEQAAEVPKNIVAPPWAP